MKKCINLDCHSKGKLLPNSDFFYNFNTKSLGDTCRVCIRKEAKENKRIADTKYRRKQGVEERKPAKQKRGTYNKEYYHRRKAEKDIEEKKERAARIAKRKKINALLDAALKETVTKTCSDCGEAKALNEFYALKHAPDGLSYYCKTCQARRTVESRNKNDRFQEKRKVYNVEKPLWPAPEKI